MTEEIMKTVTKTDVLHQLITSSCTGFDSQHAFKLVNFIQSLNQIKLCSIKTMKHSITNNTSETKPKSHLQNKYRTKSRRINTSIAELDETCPWPSGLEVAETL